MKGVKRFLCILAALEAMCCLSAKKTKKINSIDRAKDAALVVDMVQEAAELQAKADAGDAAAQRELGIHYCYGWGVARDLPMAASLFKQAAEAGDAVAMRRLGSCYERGEGVASDRERAFNYYMKAAEAGDGIAQIVLGNCYTSGFFVEQNKDEGQKWYNKGIETLSAAAEQGDNEARTELGLYYIEGMYTARQSNAKGMKLWRAAAEDGYVLAMNNVGWYYAHNAKDIPDLQKAAKWFKQAADLGDMVAQCNMGLMYTNISGLAIRTDKKKAVEYYTKSAEQGYANAQYGLGLCYLNGSGIEKDKTKAMFWLNEAAKQGHKDAQAKLRSNAEAGNTAAQKGNVMGRFYGKDNTYRIDVFDNGTYQYFGTYNGEFVLYAHGTYTGKANAPGIVTISLSQYLHNYEWVDVPVSFGTCDVVLSDDGHGAVKIDNLQDIEAWYMRLKEQ